MARYIGPKTKIARNFAEPIYGFDKYFEKRGYPSGQHGLSKKRKVKSEFATQLREKQKAKYTYGVLERQFRRFFNIAARKGGVTGENLLKLLEARLDNTVFRLGLANSRMQARQLVGHKHILVNGEVVNVPSFILRPGDKVEVREKSKGLEVIKDALAKRGKGFPWLEFNADRLEGKLLNYPERDMIPENINEQLIVELYSK